MPKRARDLQVAASHAVGERIDGALSSHHRRRLRKVGWERALDASGLAYSPSANPPAPGNRVDFLVDGSTMLPAVAEALKGAQSHVHLAGWCFSPELDLTRGEDPLILRNVLADLAERVDVRVLGWRGAPLPVFRPSRREVSRVGDRLTRGTGIEFVADSCVRLMHCHHEKTIVVDDRIAFVGGIDLTVDGGDRFDTPVHRARGRVGWHDASVRIEGPAVAAVAEHFRMRWEAPTGETLPPVRPQGPCGDVELQVVRTIPEHVYEDARSGDFSILESYCGALRAAEKLVYLENQFLWSPEVVGILADKLRSPPSDDFRVVALLPARPNDGADVSRGQIAALIEADSEGKRFLACTIYARHGVLRDLIYVHAKICIVDDRWFTIGSANLNEHSLFNDSEVNVVSLDPSLARSARLELWAEHLETTPDRLDRDSTEVVDELWFPNADEQLERIAAGSPLTHRLVKLPGVSRRRARVSGSLQSRIYDA